MIPETKEEMWGLTFLQIGGRERLVLNHDPYILPVSLDLQRVSTVERILAKPNDITPLCRSGDNKALFLKKKGRAYI